MMIALIALLACKGDPFADDSAEPVDTADTEDSGDAATQDISGAWLSEGEDISPLFAASPFNYVSVSADFAVDGSYEVVAVDDQGAAVTLTGGYVVDTTTEPCTIVLQQSQPYSAVAEGIWWVEGDALTYEVVQTQPDYGFSPPTPESGFGTSGGGGIAPDSNIQVYRR